MLEVGDKVPDFTLRVAYADGRRAFVPFHSFLGKGRIVIVFYPLAFTSTCTEDMCAARDAQAELQSIDATPFGFSIDAAPANVHFAKLHGLTHGLISDPNREIIDRLWDTQTVLGVERCAKRGYLILDASGIVAAQWITDDADENATARAIDAARAMGN